MKMANSNLDLLLLSLKSNYLPKLLLLPSL
jgi:hypothetical protein